ncbi:hypothetical protein D3C85_202630 [compost metagenome]
MNDFIQILKIFCLNAKSLSAEILKKRLFKYPHPLSPTPFLLAKTRLKNLIKIKTLSKKRKLTKKRIL